MSDLLNSVKNYLAQNQNQEAYNLLKEIIATETENSEAYDLLGLVCQKINKYDESLEAFQNATSLEPTKFIYYQHLAGNLLLQKKYEESEKAYIQAFELNSQFPWTQGNLGRTLLYQDKINEAISCFEKAIELDSEESAFYYYLGEALTKVGRYTEAITSLESAIKLNPDNFNYYHQIGDNYLTRKNYQQAVNFYNKSIALNPSYVWSHYNLGRAFSELENYQEAIASFQSAINLQPENAEIYKLLGTAQSKSGDTARAIASYRQALELNPNMAGVQEKLDQLLSRQKEINKTKSKFLDYHNQGDQLFIEEKYEAAISEYQKAIQLKPDYFWSHFNLGRAFSELGNYQEAIASFQSAIKLQPDNDQAYKLLEYAQLLRKSQEKIRQFHNKHKGERCVIIGSGPSLNQMDLSFLKDEICFGLNKIYLGFDRWDFRPTYYVAVNPLVIEQSVEQVKQLSCPKFIANRGIPYFDSEQDDLIFLKTQPYTGEPFSKNPDMALYEGSTVTYAAMQLAYYMGFEEVILIGVDHHFVSQGKPNQEITSQGDDPNHFHPDYFAKGIKWQLPDLKNSEQHYQIAKQVFEESGRKIIDATLNGHCQVFPKQDYREVFKEYLTQINDSYLGEKETESDSNFLDNHNQGDKLFGEKKYEEAITFYQKAIQLKPDYFWSYYNLGRALLNLGKWEQARKYYNQAWFLNENLLYEQYNNSSENTNEKTFTDYSLAYAKLAAIYQENGQLSQAKECYEQAITINPNIHTITYNNLAKAMSKLNLINDQDLEVNLTQHNNLDSRWEELNILKDYYNLIKTKSNGEDYLHLANILVKQKRLNSAIAVYKIIIKLYPDSKESVEAYTLLSQYIHKN